MRQGLPPWDHVRPVRPSSHVQRTARSHHLLWPHELSSHSEALRHSARRPPLTHVRDRKDRHRQVDAHGNDDPAGPAERRRPRAPRSSWGPGRARARRDARGADGRSRLFRRARHRGRARVQPARRRAAAGSSARRLQHPRSVQKDLGRFLGAASGTHPPQCAARAARPTPGNLRGYPPVARRQRLPAAGVRTRGESPGPRVLAPRIRELSLGFPCRIDRAGPEQGRRLPREPDLAEHPDQS